jgi:hypothetical protein
MIDQVLNLEIWKHFITGEGNLPNQMTLKDAWDFSSNGDSHDFIQWMFPIDTKSHINKSAPLFCEEMKFFLHANPDAKLNFIRCIKSFKNYLHSCEDWPGVNNHNNLRVSRVLRSTNLFTLNDQLYGFYAFLLDTYFNTYNKDLFNPTSLDYWRTSTFNKIIFSFLESVEQLKKFKKIVHSQIPDHNVINLTSNLLSKITLLNEPIFANVDESVDIKSINYENRGGLYPINDILEQSSFELLHKFRHWY